MRFVNTKRWTAATVLARLRASQKAIFGSRKPSEDQGLLIDSRQAPESLGTNAFQDAHDRRNAATD